MINYKKEAIKLREGFEGIIPVPIEEIARKCGVEVKYGALDGNISGMLLRQDGRATIGINAYHHRNRQNFTLAHELAHWWLQHEGEFFVDYKVIFRDSNSSSGTNDDEREANALAAELLMPEEELLRELKHSGIDIEDDEDLSALADKFAVSQKAMTYRLINLRHKESI